MLLISAQDLLSMPKISINPVLIRLNFDEFKKWVEYTLPGENAERLYKMIGGKVPIKKKKGTE